MLYNIKISIKKGKKAEVSSFLRRIFLNPGLLLLQRSDI